MPFDISGTSEIRVTDLGIDEVFVVLEALCVGPAFFWFRVGQGFDFAAVGQ